uniref:Putative conserved plasma membrane protein n=1 Tax=Amblyomma aureolatum TaxID=187763 RepID=A0A1E1WYK6_9ACAR
MQFHQRAAWVALFLYLLGGFCCLTPLFRLSNRDTLLHVQRSGPQDSAWFRLNNVSALALVIVAVLLYVQGFVVLLACTTRTDTKSRVVKSVFPFLLCAVCVSFWKKSERSSSDGKSNGIVEPLVLVV